jgi:hypothetical protein
MSLRLKPEEELQRADCRLGNAAGRQEETEQTELSDERRPQQLYLPKRKWETEDVAHEF